MGFSVKIGRLRAAAICGALGCIFVWGIVGQASATVYNINEVIDQNTNPQAIGVGSVVGTLTTDGFIGSLTDPTHIVDWNLTVTANTVSENLFGPLSGNNSTIYSLVGPALVASATELTFDYASSTPSEFWIRNGDTYWLLDAFGQLNGSFGRERAGVASPAGPQGAYKNLFESSVVGTASDSDSASASASASATPLPAALPLFAGGLGLIGLLARRRKRKQIA